MKPLAVSAAVLLFLTCLAPVSAAPLPEVPADHWTYDAITELSARGFIVGYPTGSFGGDRAITRYEMATIVARPIRSTELRSPKSSSKWMYPTLRAS